MTEKKRVDVIIDGRNFTVVGSESEDYVRNLAYYVDRKIREITSKNPRLGNTMYTTLAALNIADEYFRANNRLGELEKETKEPMSKYDTIVEELETSKSRVKDLEDEVKSLKENKGKGETSLKELEKQLEKSSVLIEMKEKELQENQNLIKSLQDKIFDNQIELVETRKELNEDIRRLDKGKKPQ